MKGKTAFVAGGTAGIGLAVSRAYVNEGARVWIGGRREDGDAIAAGIGASFVSLNVREPESYAEAFEQIPEQLDVIVLNAGIGHPLGPIASVSDKHARLVVDVHLSHLARSAAIDLGPRGIRVNAVQPGPVWTDLNAMPEELLRITAPLGRKGMVEDLTGLYVYLASDESSYMTGQALTVDGGITAGYSQALLGAVAAQMQAEAVGA
jgi:NAD(P)-dependent dehydrogenase (short-subunit alcohol dehydrogenase family)